MSDIQVRRMIPTDAESVLRLWHQSWLDTYVNPELGITRDWVDQRWRSRLTPEGTARFADRIRAGTTDNQSQYFVAERSGQLIGMAAPFVEPGRGQRVGAIYVAPDHLGTGAGTALMTAVLDALDATQPVYLQVAAFNQRAIQFYERFGFQRIPGSEQTYADTIPEFWMKLDPRI